MKSLCNAFTNVCLSRRLPAPRLVLAVIGSLGLVSCGGESLTQAGAEEKRPAPQSYPVTTPIIADVPADRQFIADIQNASHIELRTRVAGVVEKLGVDEGQRVKQGQLLIAVGSQEFESALRRAEAGLKKAKADLKVAEIELQNTHVLLGKKIISQPEVDLAQAKCDTASAAVDEAEEDVVSARRSLGYAEIRAPFDGIISRLPKKAGSMVEEGEVLTTLSSEGDAYVYFNVSEAEYLRLSERPDLHAESGLSLELADGSQYEHRGRIETHDAIIDRTTGSIAFRGRFPNPENLLRHGATGKVTVHATMRQVVVIPQKCTFEVQHKLCVYRLGADNTVSLCTIEPGLRLPHHFVIEKGLDSQDKIVFEGIQRVREGDIIVPEVRAWSESAPL